MDGSPKYTDLLVIGKTGNGKSETGNSILGRTAFEAPPSTTSVTKHVQSEYSDICGRIVKVVDGPGVCDTDLSDENALKVMCESMKIAIAANPRGYHAFLLVVRYGWKFTNEDKQAVEMLKGIFGSDFVAKFAILVVTHGDEFDEAVSNAMTFTDWCFRQTGVFRDLVDECGRRVILFDNKTKDQAKKNRQREQLFELVDNLSNSGQRYKDENFRNVERERDRILIATRNVFIQEETIMEVSLIIQELGNIQLNEPIIRLERLNQLKNRAERLLRELHDQDKGTGILNSSQQLPRNIHKIIEEQIEQTNKAIDIQKQKQQYEKEVEHLKMSTQQLQEEEGTAKKKVEKLQNDIQMLDNNYKDYLKNTMESYTVVEKTYKTTVTDQIINLIPKILEAAIIIIPAIIQLFSKK